MRLVCCFFLYKIQCVLYSHIFQRRKRNVEVVVHMGEEEAVKEEGTMYLVVLEEEGMVEDMVGEGTAKEVTDIFNVVVGKRTTAGGIKTPLSVHAL